MWPRISVVTPSFNQTHYLEETIRSVLLQGYPDIELLVIDGGSTDGSVELIRRYERWISYWVSEKDRGQSHALNKGFARASGAWVGWQNSDDYYHRDCFGAAAAASAAHPDAAVLYGQVPFVDVDGRVVVENRARDFRLEDGFPWFLLSNQGLFFRRDIFDAGLFLDENFHYCMDGEFYWRLIFAGYKFQYVPKIAGSFRQHSQAKTSTQQDVNFRETNELFRRIFAWERLPDATREVAIRKYRTFLCTAFDARRFDTFRWGVRELIRQGGLRRAGVGALLRWAAAKGGDIPAAAMARFNRFRLGNYTG
jgi:glycosyltransferase involved in cell wall biosynthesis